MRMAEWRRRRNKTQEWLAEQLEVSQSYVSAIERVDHPKLPNARVMIRAMIVTDFEVMPNDWFPIAELIAKCRNAA